MQERPLSYPFPLPTLLKGQTRPNLCSVWAVSGGEAKIAGALVFCCLSSAVGWWGRKQGWEWGELPSAASLLSGRWEAWEPKTLQHCLLELTEHEQNHCLNDKHCNKYWQDMNPGSSKASFFVTTIKAAQITFGFFFYHIFKVYYSAPLSRSLYGERNGF